MGKIKGWEKIHNGYMKGYNTIYFVKRPNKKVSWYPGDKYAVIISNPMNEVAKRFKIKKEAIDFMKRWARSHPNG